MAREHARIWLDINDDEDFCDLTPEAQWMFTRVILTLDSLNYCGVADWRPPRLVNKAKGITVPRILVPAAELEQRRYLLFDLDTEEVLARSYIRRDELLRNPKMAATVIKAYPGIASPVLRAAVITEVQRIHREHPEYSSWTHKDTAAGLDRLLKKDALAVGGYTMQITIPNPVQNGIPNPVPISDPDSVPNTDRHPGPDNQSNSVRNPSTSTLHHSPAPLVGNVSGERNQGTEPDSNAPPTRTCPSHPNGTAKACRDCETDRKALKAWTDEQTARNLAAIEARARLQRKCTDCDEAGWVLDENRVPVEPATPCTHPAASHA